MTGEPASGASARIDHYVASFDDWRGDLLAHIRALIRQADADVVEEWKWDGPVWSRGGIICTGEVYKSAVKTTFAKGASLPDPAGLFNASLTGKTRRAIDFHNGVPIDEAAFMALIKAAIAHNLG
ncbi:hypothetical protein SAMN05216456_2553 [Devosia crocina]|uniref:YdhG-like domain-containing protein n=1 Tax=Devosia crocina TaxID=429728 RepID=A0A1I7NPH7_9HYPH|nr:DUF1801 domain-containing protein [Devosia crocina]SFV36566.1 hypothetical protein SAMN05216456_2553 [Devosia crocina]